MLSGIPSCLLPGTPLKVSALGCFLVLVPKIRNNTCEKEKQKRNKKQQLAKMSFYRCPGRKTKEIKNNKNLCSGRMVEGTKTYLLKAKQKRSKNHNKAKSNNEQSICVQKRKNEQMQKKQSAAPRR